MTNVSLLKVSRRINKPEELKILAEQLGVKDYDVQAILHDKKDSIQVKKNSSIYKVSGECHLRKSHLRECCLRDSCLRGIPSLGTLSQGNLVSRKFYH